MLLKTEEWQIPYRFEEKKQLFDTINIVIFSF